MLISSQGEDKILYDEKTGIGLNTEILEREDYKEYLKKQKVRRKYDEEVVVNEQKSFIKILLFLFEIMIRIFHVLFYIGILILCSIGATYIANKIGIFKF